MRASYSSFVLSTMLLAGPCLADEDSDIPVAAWEIPADATRPENVIKRLDDLQTPNLDRPNIADPIETADSNQEPASKAQRQQVPFMDRPTLAPAISPLPPVAGTIPANESLLPSTPRRPTSWKDDSDTYNQQTAATVNGERILMGEVLDRYTLYLKALRDDLQLRGHTRAEYNKQREACVQRELCAHIQHRLFAAAIMTHLSPQQMLELSTQVNANFVKQEEPKLLQQLGVTNREQLESALDLAGGSIKYTRKNYLTKACSAEFQRHELSRDDAISVDDMKAYYEAHLDDYARPATVDWEQIQITYFDDAAKAECLNRIRQARTELLAQAPVADVVKNYSDGSTAKDGGVWKAMAAGTLADSKLEELLFEMPRGEWSEIHEGLSEYQLVRVLKRTPAGAAPFEDVEDKIRFILNSKRLQSLVHKMIANADIETEFDLSGLYNWEQ